MTLRLLQAGLTVALGLLAWHPGLASALVAVAAFACLEAHEHLHLRQGRVAELERDLDAHEAASAAELSSIQARLKEVSDKVVGVGNASTFARR